MDFIKLTQDYVLHWLQYETETRSQQLPKMSCDREMHRHFNCCEMHRKIGVWYASLMAKAEFLDTVLALYCPTREDYEEFLLHGTGYAAGTDLPVIGTQRWLAKALEVTGVRLPYEPYWWKPEST